MKKLIHDPKSFPETHIIADHFHYVQLYDRTLLATSPRRHACKGAFSAALYAYVTDDAGNVVKTHAQPCDIVDKVNLIIDEYSKGPDACITDATRT